MNKIIIEQQGARWIASQGTVHSEGKDPEQSLISLLTQLNFPDDAIDRDQKAEAERLVESHVINLIRVIAISAPASIIRHEVEAIRKATESLLEYRE